MEFKDFVNEQPDGNYYTHMNYDLKYQWDAKDDTNDQDNGFICKRLVNAPDPESEPAEPEPESEPTKPEPESESEPTEPEPGPESETAEPESEPELESETNHLLKSKLEKNQSTRLHKIGNNLVLIYFIILFFCN